MKITLANYHRLARAVGALLTLMGLGLLAVFLVFVSTGQNPLAAPPLALSDAGMLIFGSVGAFALPLGMSLLWTDASTPSKLQLAACALWLMALIRLAAYASADMRALLGAAPLVEFFVLGGVASLAYFLRPDNEAPLELRTQIELDAPASVAWRVLGEEFGSVGEWASSLRSSSLDRELGAGAHRTCEVQGFGPFPPGTIIEELLEFDREAMRFSYRPTAGMPPMFLGAQNRWSVEVIDERRCRVRSHASIELRWWALPLAKLLARSICSGVDGFAEELRHRVERGEPHPRKLAMPA